MKLDVKFSESNQSFNPTFGEVNNISDGGFERGYEQGYVKGTNDGFQSGFNDGYTKGYGEGETKGYESGLAARTYETWTITLTDGNIVEKEVALL